MQIEFIVNGGVSLLLSPDTDAEEALLKQMMNQRNELIDIRSTVMVLNKTFKSGVLITKEQRKASLEEVIIKDDETNKEDLP